MNTLICGIPVGGNPLRMLPNLHLGTFAKLATRRYDAGRYGAGRYGAGREQQERLLVDVACSSSNRP